jgi:autotransporter adhesin
MRFIDQPDMYFCQIVRHPSFMNRIFKAVWNESSGAWVAASETSKSKTKRSSSAQLRIAQTVMIGGLLAGVGAQAHAQVSDDWAAPKAGLMAAPKVSGVNAYAAGENAVANGDQAMAIGASSNAGNLLASAVGANAAASGGGATAVGAFAQAAGDNAAAIGAFAQANGENAVAVGVAANANDENAIAVGNASMATTNAVAIGPNAAANGAESIALGNGSAADGASSNALGAHAIAAADGATALGTSAQANEIDALAVGHSAIAAGPGSIAVGGNANAAFKNSIAIGNNAIANNANSVALGAGSVTTVGAQSGYAAYGLSDPQTSTGEVNVGGRTISGVAAGAVDTDAVNVAQLKAVSDQATAAAASADAAVKYDRSADGSVDHGNVTLEGDGGTAIHNVAAGVDATDAVNVGQLDDAIGQVNASVGNAVNDAVRNAVINASDPLFSADGSPGTDAASATGVHSVAAGAGAVASGADSVAMGSGAQASADNSVALGQNAVVTGTGSVAMGNGAQASASDAVALGQNSVADRANTVSVGAAGSERQITNVAAGTQGTDAVNVNQLNQSAGSTLKQANDYTDSKTEGTRRDAYAGTAAALAVAGLPQAVLPGRGMVALGGGTYGGQSAVAIGVSQLSDNGIWAYKVSGTTSTRGQFGVSVGAGMHW